MIKRILLVFSLLIFTMPSALADPAFWTAKRDGLTLHILGTIHMLTPDILWQSGTVSDALEGSDRLVLELSPGEMDEQRIAFLVQQRGMYAAGEGLAGDISPDLMDRTLAAGGQLGLPESFLRRMRPWYASIVIGLQAGLAQGFQPDLGVETILTGQAQAAGIPVDGLETAAEQFNALADHPLSIQAAFLEETVRQLEETPDMLRKLATAWSEGDTQTVHDYLVASMADTPALQEALIVQRNNGWMEIIEGWQGPETVFLAVGAGHLTGSYGLLSLLDEAEFTVERIQ